MRVQFYDDPVDHRRPRQKVRFNQLGLYLYEDRRRLAVGFDITPFEEEPSINVAIVDKNEEEVTTLGIVNANQPRFDITVHFKDEPKSSSYKVLAHLYYFGEDGKRTIVDKIERELDMSRLGEQ